ncbi:MAG: helix-turn-helix domain-containing protein [Acidobacteriia bacterium]|nr:helix-turn-helix domain-containing protein [Terriglobia bacterium]
MNRSTARQGGMPDACAGTEKLSNTPAQALVANSSEAPAENPVGPEQAAEFLRVSRSTVLALARKGVIPAHPVTNGRRNRWLFFISELSAHIRGLGVNCGSHPCAS